MEGDGGGGQRRWTAEGTISLISGADQLTWAWGSAEGSMALCTSKQQAREKSTHSHLQQYPLGDPQAVGPTVLCLLALKITKGGTR